MNLNNKIASIALLFLIVTSCKDEAEKNITNSGTVGTSVAYNEPFRPQFHFSPPEKWMNDPNGLVYNDGVYHLFYQYYPEDIVWGPMHWGHATSPDLIHWENKPIALYPDELGLIFSGSAVVDKNNTSGFGTAENPPLVAIYTYHLVEGEKEGRLDYQTQGLAYSLDNGETWTKYEGNPVIGNDGIKDFRDPKVFWHEESSRWILVLVAGDRAKFYKSTNLKDWNLMSEFGSDMGAHGGVWECPDLFKLKVGDTGKEKWVLIISINPGAPNGGSGTQYFVGDFNGETFFSDQAETKWLDYGMDNYAGVTYNNVPSDDRIFIGWMSNWNYARDTPTEVWRSAMTLPRNISLHLDDEGYYIKNYPLKNFDSLASTVLQERDIDLSEPFILDKDNFNNTDTSFTIDSAGDYSVTFSNESGEQVCFQFLGKTGELLFDRTRSGMVNFEESFGKAVQTQLFHSRNEKVEIRIIMDASSIEIFIDGGKHVFTNQLFPNQKYTKLEITGQPEGRIEKLSIKDVKSIWRP
jgi:fructan beta-fructosidase